MGPVSNKMEDVKSEDNKQEYIKPCEFHTEVKGEGVVDEVDWREEFSVENRLEAVVRVQETLQGM